MNIQRNKGFNLIELMIVIAIVGILSAIAMPSYKAYVIRGARSAAQTELLTLASLEEKIYLNSSAYIFTTAKVTTAYTGSTAGGLGVTSGKTTDGKYALALSGSAQLFTITATPVAGTPQVGDGCLTIQENGLRQWHENTDACNLVTPTAW